MFWLAARAIVVSVEVKVVVLDLKYLHLEVALGIGIHAAHLLRGVCRFYLWSVGTELELDNISARRRCTLCDVSLIPATRITAVNGAAMSSISSP
jgi:hypothetical protein